jgi:hypothetical protein
MKTTIKTANGSQTVTSYRTDTPGLVVTKVTLTDGKTVVWTITHTASGYHIGHSFATRKEAIAAAGRLNGLADWTLCRSKLTRNRKLGPRVKDALDVGPARIPSAKPTTITLDVRNRQTGERRVITISEEEGARAICDTVNTCTGPCECLIEPDSVCPYGWPALEQAIVACS